MPRLDRVDYVGARHHVMNRGARRTTIFLDSDCCGQFLELVGELPERYGIAVHAYTLMPNHFHLLLESRSAKISVAMAYLQSRYSYWLNQRYDWDGPLYRGRFRNRVVEIEEYWRHLFAYLHLNPVRGHLAPTADKADWTSHSVYMGFERRPDWLTTDDFYECFGTLDAYRQYVHELQIGKQTHPGDFDPDEIWDGPATGIVKLYLGMPIVRAGNVPKEAYLDEDAGLEKGLGELEKVLGLPRNRFLTSPRGRQGNRARWVVAWWLTRWGRASGLGVAGVLGIKRAGVSQLAAKAARCREDDEQLDAWMLALEDLALETGKKAKSETPGI